MELNPNEFKALYSSPLIENIKIFRRGIIPFARIDEAMGTTKTYWYDQNFSKWKETEE